MKPEEQLRALRGNDRWEETGLTPRVTGRVGGSGPRRRGIAVPVVVTALVAALVIVASIGAIQFASTRARLAPATTPTATAPAGDATAVIRGTATTTTRTIAGVGVPGGPTAAEIRDLQALAERTGKLTDQPDTSRNSQVRLSSAFRSVRAAFGPALHEFGGSGPHFNGFFIVLNRTPTWQEVQLLRLLPTTVRLSWGPRISVKERDRQQQAAFFAAADDVLDAGGNTDSETDTQTFTYWPDRDHPRTAEQVAQQMAGTITR